MTHTFPVGTSEPLDFQLYDQGVALDGTGLTLELEIVYANGDAVPSPEPVAAWLTQAAGTVRVTGAEILTVGAYRVRYKLTDGLGNIGYAPNRDSADEWDVVQVLP